MAITNRKLFPTLTSSNATVVYCPDLCDPACPYYDCPDFYFPQPPPPPPPPPTSSTTISPSLITSLALLSGFFILLGYCVVIVKSCFCRRFRNIPAHAPNSSSEDADQEFVDENRVDHPVWFITTVGLQQSIINAIAACRYRKGEGLIEGSECSVCLNDFREGETLRLLPKCSHAFHLRCIDTWLRSHTNCPLCRANIVAPVGAEPEHVERHNEYSGVNGGLDVDLHGIREEMEESQVEGTEEVASKDCAAHGELQMPEETELESGSVSLSVDGSSSSTSSPEHQIYVGARKPSGAIAALKQDGRLEVVAAAHCSSIGQGPVPMERSRSCGSGFILSRHSRTMSSILPF